MAYQWKMFFNPDLNKQAQEIKFSRKTAKSSHLLIYVSDAPVSRVSFQKHLGVYLDEILKFSYPIKQKCLMQ